MHRLSTYLWRLALAQDRELMGEKQTMILADNGYYLAGFTVDSVAQFNCNETY